MRRILMIMMLALFSMTVLGAVGTVRADETLVWGTESILSTGEPISSPPLRAGLLYRIVVWDYFWYENNPIQHRHLAADAQYYTTQNSDGKNWRDYFPAPSGHSFVQINGMDVNWGPFSNGDYPGHRYSIYYVPTTSEPITLTIVDWVDRDFSNNLCHLYVRIYELPACAGSPRTIGFWKNHPDAWPVDSLTVGGVTYTKVQALQILRDANAKDATKMLAAQLIAAKLNVLSGAWCGTSSTIFDTYTLNASDTFLAAHPWGSNPRGAERTYALMLKDILDSFNNGG